MKCYLIGLLAALFMCSVECELCDGDSANEVHLELKNKVKELIKKHNQTDMYTLNVDKNLAIFILRAIIEEELTAKNTKQIVNYVRSQHEDFLYTGYVKMYQVIRERSLGDSALFELASQVKQDLYRGQVMTLMSMFPIAVRSIFTSSSVCIKNRGYGEYLYAAANDLKRDNTHRNVFTWRPKSEAGKPGDWVFQHIEGNHFHIVDAMFGERFFAEDDAYNKDSERRSVFTSNLVRDNKDVWALEMEGEEVFIKNVHFNEYLYALDGREYDDLRRMVLTWIPKGRAQCDSDSYQCRWFISMC